MTRFGLVNWLCKVGTFGETHILVPDYLIIEHPVSIMPYRIRFGN
jgi:hypothetical protein